MKLDCLGYFWADFIGGKKLNYMNLGPHGSLKL